MPIVDRGGLVEIGDQLAGLLYSIESNRIEYEYEYGKKQEQSIASDFVVLVLSEAVLSETVLVLDGCLDCGDADR
jgi:hypothetical protein